MISVIIPCFNSEDYVSRAIESVLKQSYNDYEIILVNNNSTDNTINILNEYSGKSIDRIRVYNEIKKGAPAARNKGLSEAKGEWIQFLDADDELLPEKLADQIEVANYSEADIIVGNCYLEKLIDNKTERKIRDIETDNLWKGLITSKLGITSANLWRKQAVLTAGSWSESRSSSQEYNLIFNILKNNEKISYCLTPLTIIYVRENSVHKSADKSRFIQILDNNIKLRLEIKAYLKSKNLLTKQLSYIIDTYIYSYLYNATALFPLISKKGIVSEYVSEAIRKNDLDIPLEYILNFHFKRLFKKVKNKL